MFQLPGQQNPQALPEVPTILPVRNYKAALDQKRSVGPIVEETAPGEQPWEVTRPKFWEAPRCGCKVLPWPLALL